ncbi:hypothetical protein [Aeromicrobium sp. UC242_57]|uniref:hypothetical protein n=1 Tax=Aeromicrobium sp. UC242_57 TaxID=3374624 RepID=UPI0037A64DF9
MELGFCGPSAAGCGPTTPVTTLADGSSTAKLTVPADAATGAGSIRATSQVGGDDVVLDQQLSVLDKPALELLSTSTSTRLNLTGEQWDPLRPVRVTAVDDSGDRVGSSVRVEAGTGGALTARVTVPDDAEVASVVAVQQRPGSSLEATVDVDLGGGGGGGGGETENENQNNGGGTTTTPVASAPATLPLDIPAPVDMPVTSVDGPQAGALPADALAVSKVRLAGSTGLADLFGGGPERVLRFQVENVGTVDAVAPGLSIAVGKGDDADPIYTSDGFGRLAPGDSLNVEIPISLSAGAFGVYTITGQLGAGESGAFTVEWETYPWGLFGLNALGLLLIVFAVRRRVFAPKPSRVSALVAAPGAGVAAHGDAGAAVIDLDVLEKWWALQSDDAGLPTPVGVGATADAVVDVDAVERWLERCSSRSAEMEHSAQRASSAN